eukprot:1300564-Alexandrium_andersonii.AAC.1
MCARAGATITDVYWHTQLRMEHAMRMHKPLLNLQLDREKFFDRFTYDIILNLNRETGCPQAVVAARRNFYGKL